MKENIETCFDNKQTHLLDRTSPMGGPFIGKCRYCGAEGLRPIQCNELCPARGEKTAPGTWIDGFYYTADGLNGEVVKVADGYIGNRSSGVKWFKTEEEAKAWVEQNL